ncbi:TIGR04222 domain-containing membrane protein [Micromonospora polyrhachis]|uniref:Uncharacterized protein (TIGR04222 family) n=1 Tax=Micromonospora polyrhachis TaxID=1282883 RepID=A0A7W7SXK3_9ACTN|nr:TIGR04222 domain-containing membrane protein [Micromonospora polyrhachis]MBB4961500.1 uncharacterized protein (TIGR04222 family) [Micromonospora polyrhachis]
MTISLAAAGDTWGISGPVFLLVYFIAADLLVFATLAHRFLLFAGPRGFRDADRLHPQQVAYLNGGARLAVDAALGGLRAAGALSGRNERIVSSGSLPVGATQLDQAIYNAVSQGIRPSALRTHQWVVQAIDQLRRQLEVAGLVPTLAQRRTARLVPLLLVGLVGLGAVRLIAGLSADKPVGFLIALLAIVTVVTVVLLVVVPRQTRAAKSALRQLRIRHVHLSPGNSPSYSSYGTTSAAMAVGLFGGAALWGLDPRFAAEAEVQRNAIASGGSSGSSGCGGGGGSDGGGGSGCGGGGCGG